MTRFLSRIFMSAILLGIASAAAFGQYGRNPQAQLLQLQTKQALYQQAAYQQAVYQQAVYQQAAYQQAVYQQALSQQAAYQQALYQQATYQQAAYQQALSQQAAKSGPTSRFAVQGEPYRPVSERYSDSQRGWSEEEIDNREDEIFVNIRTKQQQRKRPAVPSERDGQPETKSEEMNRISRDTSTIRTRTKNSPADNIEGGVTKTDGLGLVALSVGSEDGLVEGSTLEVFRLSPAKYLGTVRVTYVKAHEAVAKPVGKLVGPIQQGDRVASNILGR